MLPYSLYVSITTLPFYIHTSSNKQIKQHDLVENEENSQLSTFSFTHLPLEQQQIDQEHLTIKALQRSTSTQP